MGDYTDVVKRMGPKVAASRPDNLTILLRQARQCWGAFLRMSAKRYDMALLHQDTTDIERVLLQRDQELTLIEAHVARVTARMEAGK